MTNLSNKQAASKNFKLNGLESRVPKDVSLKRDSNKFLGLINEILPVPSFLAHVTTGQKSMFQIRLLGTPKKLISSTFLQTFEKKGVLEIS